MQTLGEILKKTADFFAGKKLESPRLQIELILAATLHCKRLDLYLQFDRPLQEETLALLRDRVRRRAAREPLQYILGETEFREITLKCDRRALIPRPETEELVGYVLAELPPAPAAMPDIESDTPVSESASAPIRVADLGTGTGAIALSIATERPDVQMFATDASADALALARENAARLGLAARVEFATGNWLQTVPTGMMRFNAIISNPPYLTKAELATAAPEVAAHEPHIALVAAEDGLSDLKTILTQARNWLIPGGFVALESGITHAVPLAAHAIALDYSRHESRKDMSGRDRFFIAWA